MTDWRFLTNHALVLMWIAVQPESTAREIASHVGITERTALKIIGELEAEGYLTRTRKGRRNSYAIDLRRPLRHHLARDVTVGELIDVIAPPRRRALA